MIYTSLYILVQLFSNLKIPLPIFQLFKISAIHIVGYLTILYYLQMFGHFLFVEKHDGTIIWRDVDKMWKDATLVSLQVLFRNSPRMYMVNVEQAYFHRNDHSFGQVRAGTLPERTSRRSCGGYIGKQSNTVPWGLLKDCMVGIISWCSHWGFITCNSLYRTAQFIKKNCSDIPNLNKKNKHQ